MATIRKKESRKIVNLKTTTVIVIEKDILPEEVSCPEKIAAAKAMLRNVKVMDPRIGPIKISED
jgi:hypothetical protein